MIPIPVTKPVAPCGEPGVAASLMLTFGEVRCTQAVCPQHGVAGFHRADTSMVDY